MAALCSRNFHRNRRGTVPPRCLSALADLDDRRRKRGGGPVAERGGGRKKRTSESFEWRELLKSARPLKFSPVVNYPKKEITVGFDRPPTSVTLLPTGFLHPLRSSNPPPPGPSGLRSRDRRSLFPRVKTLSTRSAAVSDKKLAGVANVSTLNHIFIATLIQPF